jgi:hypothetical protein
MEKQFYILKIQQLGDDNLKELLKLRTKENLEIIALAEKEAIKRGIDLQTIKGERNKINTSSTKPNKTEGINWTEILGEIFS